MNDKQHSFEQFQFDWHARDLRCDDQLIEIEPKCLDLLHFLIENRHRAVAKDELAEHLWPDRVISDSVISKAVSKIRSVLTEHGSDQEVIRTIHGFGYRFVGELKETRPASISSRSPGAITSRPMVVVGLALVVVLAFIATLSMRPAGAPEPVTVAIVPTFEVADPDQPSWLAGSLVDTLSTWLSQSERLILLPSSLVRAQIEQAGDRAGAVERLMTQLGADIVIDGRLEREGDDWLLSVDLSWRGKSPRNLRFRDQDALAAAMQAGRRLLTDISPGMAVPADIFLADEWLNETFLRGLDAIRAGDPRRAAQLFETVLEYAPGFDRAVYEHAVALRQMGHAEDSSDLFRSLIESDTLSDPAIARLAANALAVNLWHQGQLSEADDLFAFVVADAARSRQPIHQATALLSRGMIASNRGDFEQAEQFYVDSMARFSEIGYQPGRALVSNSLGVMAFNRGDPALAAVWHRGALELRIGLGQQRDIAQSLHNLGVVEAALLNPEEAERLLDQARMMRKAMQNRREYALTTAKLGLHRARTGRISAGRPLLIEARELAAEIADRRLEIRVLNWLAGVEWLAGKPFAALDWLDEVQTIMTEQEETGIFVLLQRSRMLLEQGDLVAAHQALALADQASADSSNPTIEAARLTQHGRLMMAEHRLEDARDWLNLALASLAASSDLRARAEIASLLLEVHLALLDVEAARRLLEQLPVQAHQLPGLLVAQAQMAFLEGDQAQAVELAQQALSAVGEINIRSWRERLAPIIQQG